jgi:hypothetical protein
MARDYRAEYLRRVQHGSARGLTRSQARGHPATGLPYASGRRITPSYDPVLEEGVKEIRAGGSLRRAAHVAHVPEERFRRYLVATGVATKEGGRWRIGRDRRARVVVMYSRGRAEEIVVAGYDDAAEVGDYMNDVARFQESNDRALLARWSGRSVTDVRGRSWRYETNPNTLYRLLAAGPEPFEQIYRIVVL